MIERQKRLYLCRPSGSIMYQLNGVDTTTVHYEVRAKGYNTITFDVDRYIVIDGNQVESSGYEDLRVGMYLLLEGEDLFVLQEPTLNNDGIREYKSVTANSAECEFQDKDWVGLKVNTADPDSLEYLIDGNVETNEFGWKMPKEYVTLYKSNGSNKTDLSLLHWILKKMPGWSVSDNDISHSLWDKQFKIEEDNINLYALLTSVVAPQAECLFLFDTIHRKIKAIAKSELDGPMLDTTIYISMRNLMQSVEVSTNEDSVYTVFNVIGGDEDELNVADVNYGDTHVYDLTYFMGQPWMSDEMVAKIQSWMQWRDDNRSHYEDLAKKINQLQLEIEDITYRLPNDACTYSQWDVMEEKTLRQNKELYEEQLLDLQIIADHAIKDDSYTPRTKPDGSVDHEYYEDQLLENEAGYWAYIQLYKYIIPNINIALENKGKIQSDKKDYVEDYETDWALFGISELESKEDSYSRQLKTLKDYAKPWSELSDDEKAKNETESNYNRTHDVYTRIENYLGTPETEGTLRYRLAQLREQVDSINDEINETRTEQQTYKDISDISNEAWGLTETELLVFNRLSKYTDYDNNNIITTSLDSTVTKIDHEMRLYEDSVSKLSEVSQPQYSFNVSLDNFLNIPQFYVWGDRLDILSFMRVAIREDYTVKLRLIAYTTNPCEIDPELTLEFSNFITSRSGRSDLTELLELTNTSPSKNSVSIGTGGTKDDIEYVTKLLQTMRKNGMFSSVVGAEATSIITAGSVASFDVNKLNADFANIDYANVDTLDVAKLYANTGLIDSLTIHEGKCTGFLDSVQVNAESITAGTLITDRLLIRGELNADGSRKPGILYAMNKLTGKVTEQQIDYDELNGYILSKNTVNADRVVAHSITANQIATHTLTADEITTHDIIGSHGVINFDRGEMYFGAVTKVYKPVESNDEFDGGRAYYTKDESENEGEGQGEGENEGTHDKYTRYDATADNWADRPQLYYQDYNIADEKLSWNGRTLTINGDGHFSGELTAATGTFAGQLSAATGTFSGELSAATGSFSGEVTANTGKIGGVNGFTIKAGKMYSGTHENYNTASDGVYIGTDYISLGSGGVTYFSNKGTGKIGPWELSTTYFRNGSIANSGSNSVAGVYLGTDGLNVSCGTAATTAIIRKTPNNGIYVNFGNKFTWDGNNLTINGGGTFSGNLSAAKGTFSGELSAVTGSFNSGTIGGWTLNSTALIASANNANTGNVTCYTGLQVPGAGVFSIAVGSTNSGNWTTAPFRVTHTGILYATGANISGNITATEGKIGGFNIDPSGISYDANNTGVQVYTGGITTKGLDGNNNPMYCVMEYTRFHAIKLLDNSSTQHEIVVEPAKIDISSTNRNSRIIIDGTVADPDMSITATSNKEARVIVKNEYNEGKLQASSGKNFGLYSTKFTKWVIRCDENGNIYADLSSSDVRLKKNIKDTSIINARSIVDAIKIRQFDWKQDGHHQDIGFIADELEEIDPHLAFGGGENEYGGMNVKNVDTFYLLGYLTKAFQELSAEVKELRDENNYLKDRLKI